MPEHNNFVTLNLNGCGNSLLANGHYEQGNFSLYRLPTNSCQLCSAYHLVLPTGVTEIKKAFRKVRNLSHSNHFHGACIASPTLRQGLCAFWACGHSICLHILALHSFVWERCALTNNSCLIAYNKISGDQFVGCRRRSLPILTQANHDRPRLSSWYLLKS